MRWLTALASYFSSTSVLVAASGSGCKCTPDSSCWPSQAEWSFLNTTLSGRLIHSVPPASVCYQSQPNYNEARCEFVRSQWFNSTWHAQDPISIDYPIWANHSCDPIWPNGTSLTGDANAGKRGCSIGNYPVYVVDARTADHVGTAIKWAGRKNVRVVVKNTGHSFPGRSTGYGSLSIWTHNFRGIEAIDTFKPTSCPINGTLRAVRVAAGHTGYEVQSELSKLNRIIVTGANPDVGLMGWITNGGHGTLSSTYGMGADNLLEATIVTPDGRVLLTNPCVNSDLFFAIRGGGGGTYGIVLSAIIKTFPSPRTTLHSLSIASLSSNVSTEYYDLIGFLHAEMPRLKAGGMQGYYGMLGPPVMPTLSFVGGFYIYDKPSGTIEKLMEPVKRYLDNRKDIFAYQQETTTTENYWDSWGKIFSNEAVANGGAAFGSRLLSEKSLEDPRKSARVFEHIGPSVLGKNGPYSNSVMLGHMIASPIKPSYYPDVSSTLPAWRNTLTHVVVVESWRDGMPREAIEAVYRDITYNKTEPLRQLSPETGAYFNEPDSFEPKWQEAFFGENYERLRKIKEKYDPKNVLWCQRCVGSEAMEEQPNGQLCRPRGGYGYSKKARSHPHDTKRAGGYYLKKAETSENDQIVDPNRDVKRGWGADFPSGSGKAESTDPDWPQRRGSVDTRGQHGSLD